MSSVCRAFVRSAIGLTLLCVRSINANIISFEDLPDAYFFNSGDQNIGNVYSGITFGPNVTGLSVSRFGGYPSDAFPPHSGDVVIWDSADPTITIDFASSISSFGIWYTSFDPLTLQAFDASNNLLGTLIGNPNTDGTTGTTSFLSFANPSITAVDLTSSPGLFTLDDLTFSSTTTVPEPNTFLYIASILICALLFTAPARARYRRRGTLVLLGVLTASISSGQTGFTGHTVSVDYEWPQIGTVLYSAGSAVVGSGGTSFVLPGQGGTSADIISTNVLITYPVGWTFNATTPKTFDGWVITDVSAHIAGASLVGSSINGFTAAQLSFDSHHVYINGLGFSAFAAGSSIVVHVEFEEGGPTLNGSTLAANIFYPTSSTILKTQNVSVGAPFPEITCPGGNEGGGICGSFGDPAQLTIDNHSILFTQQGSGRMTTAAYNGIGFSNLSFSDGAVLTGFILVTNLAGLTPQAVSFGAHSIQLNFEGLSFTNGYFIQLDLVTTSTPSPSFFGSGGTTANPTISFAEPVNTATGNYYYTHTDLSVHGRGISFVFTRQYNSLDYYSGPLGVGWTHSYNVLLSANPQTGVVTVKNGDGSTLSFSPTGGGAYTPDTGVHDQLRQNSDNTFTLTRKNQTLLNFSSVGQLLTIVDRNGNTQWLAYDASGNLTSVTDTVGRSFQFTYDSNSHLTTVMDPASRKVVFTYDSNSDLVGYQDSLGNMTQYGYDPNHHLVSGTDPRGVQYVQNTYDNSGRVVLQKDGRNFATTFAYDSPTSGTTTITDPLGNVTKHVYDASDRLVQVINARSGTITYTYDTSNNRTSVTNLNGKTTQFLYDVNGNVTKILTPLGGTALLSYDSRNNVTATTTPGGRVTLYTYDPKNNLVAIQDALGNRTTFTYDGTGQLISRTNASGNTWTFTYDGNGNVVQSTSPTGRSNQYTYDLIGRQLTRKDPNGHASTVVYDALGRTVKRIDAMGNTVQSGYDSVGNLTVFTDGNGNSTAYQYDNTNDLIKVTDAAGHVVAYTYDANRNRVTVTNGNSKTTTYSYDALSRRTTIVDPLGLSKTYKYDPYGNLISITDANQKTHGFSYDALNRLVSRVYADGNTILYSYDADGDRTAMTDSQGTTNYSYDALRRLLDVIDARGNRIQYSYTPTSQRAAVTYPDGRSVSYGYDNESRLQQVKDWSGRVTTYSYDAAGNVAGVAYANGVISTYSYDSANRMIGVRSQANGRMLSSVAYVLDSAGNKIQSTDAAGGITEYTYDRANEMIGWVSPSGQVTTYSYDGDGNRAAVAAANGMTVYKYDDDDRLVAAGTAVFTYDGNGNRVTKSGSSTTSYTYDSMNRLINITAGSASFEFLYDGDGNRLQLRNSGVATEYTNDIGLTYPSVLTETGTNGSIDYQFGLSLLSGSANGFEFFYQKDGNGSMTSVTDSSGNLKANYTYDPWGKVLNPVDPLGNKNALKFSGERLDPTGLYYFRARYYDPAVGAFISKDPIPGSRRNPISHNRYSYAHNNPNRFSDHSGRSVDVIGGDVGLTTGGLLQSSLLFADYPIPLPRGVSGGIQDPDEPPIDPNDCLQGYLQSLGNGGPCGFGNPSSSANPPQLGPENIPSYPDPDPPLSPPQGWPFGNILTTPEPAYDPFQNYLSNLPDPFTTDYGPFSAGSSSAPIDYGPFSAGSSSAPIDYGPFDAGSTSAPIFPDYDFADV